MKNFLIAFMFFAGIQVFCQSTKATSVTGIITDVRSHFGGEYAMNVGKTEVVLIVSPKDKSFEINKEYQDLLIEKDGKFILNPKYENKTFRVIYTVNGKGWKCIQSIKPHHK